VFGYGYHGLNTAAFRVADIVLSQHPFKGISIQ